MDLTIFLTQVIGLYLVLMGVILLFRRRTMMKMMADIITNKALIYLIAILELLAGLALVVSHNIWVWDYSVIITIVGWLMLIESLVYLVLPYKMVKRLFRSINKPSVYVAGGLLAVVLGFYMVGIGFNLF